MEEHYDDCGEGLSSLKEEDGGKEKPSCYCDSEEELMDEASVSVYKYGPHSTIIR